jgi:peroxidase
MSMNMKSVSARSLTCAALFAGILLLADCSGHSSGNTPSTFTPAIVSTCASKIKAATVNAGGGCGATAPVTLLMQFRPIGGVGNNLANPTLNAVPGSAELSLTPLSNNTCAASTNIIATVVGNCGGSTPSLNARTISNAISGGTGSNGQNGETNDSVHSAWLYLFGQFVDHDISLEETPQSNAAINITIPAGDPVFPSGTIIAMNRATRNSASNTIITTNAGYLDLSQLYGSDATTAASLTNADGTLTSSDSGLALPVVSGNFVTGDPRVMENPELTAVTTLFMREHNFWVQTLKTQNPAWTPTQLYNMAKAITTAEYENIVYTEYLPALVGSVLGPYPGYNASVNAQVTQEFSTAAFRVGHSQVSDTEQGLNNAGGVVFIEPLAQAFFNTPQNDETNGIDALLRNIGSDFSQATDVYVVPTLRNQLHAGLVGGDVDLMDLIAIDIQRESDVGLATLNQTRQAIGMQPYTSFAQLTPDTILQQNLQAVYGSIDNVDLFIGGLAEPASTSGGLVGPTFQYIIVDQFQRLRSGDRFCWQNEGFDQQTATTIANTTLTALLKRDTDSDGVFQANMFIQQTYQ